MIRIGCIGSGRHMTQRLLPALQSHSGVAVTHLCSQTAENAHAAAKRFRIPNVLVAWPDMLTQPIDAIVVSGPPLLHMDVLDATLRRGVPTFVEKPPATSFGELEHLVELERSHRALVFVDYNYRFSPLAIRFQTGLTTSPDGCHLRLRFLTNKPRERFWDHPGTLLGDMLYGVAIHPLELAVHILGRCDLGGCELVKGADESVTIRLHVHGPRGAAEIELGNGVSRLDAVWEARTSGVHLRLRDFSVLEGHPDNADPESYLGVDHERYGYAGALTSFVQSIEAGVPSSSPLSDSLHVYELIDLLLENL